MCLNADDLDCQLMMRKYIDGEDDQVTIQLGYQRKQFFQSLITVGASALATEVAMSSG